MDCFLPVILAKAQLNRIVIIIVQDGYENFSVLCIYHSV